MLKTYKFWFSALRCLLDGGSNKKIQTLLRPPSLVVFAALLLQVSPQCVIRGVHMCLDTTSLKVTNFAFLQRFFTARK